jgi:site-specific recombinase XerD
LNYIQQLQIQRNASNRCIEDARMNLTIFKAYLQSNKFHTDPTIQVQDVLNRLTHIEECLRESYYNEIVDSFTTDPQ